MSRLGTFPGKVPGTAYVHVTIANKLEPVDLTDM
jgi:hypothetical protein